MWAGVRWWTPTRWWLRWTGSCEGPAWTSPSPSLPRRTLPCGDHPKVVLTPHLGGFSPEYADRLADIFATNLQAFRGEGEWVNLVV